MRPVPWPITLTRAFAHFLREANSMNGRPASSRNNYKLLEENKEKFKLIISDLHYYLGDLLELGLCSKRATISH